MSLYFKKPNKNFLSTRIEKTLQLNFKKISYFINEANNSNVSFYSFATFLYDILFSTSCYLWKCSTSATRTDNQNRENILHVLDKEPTIYSSEDHCCSCLLKRNLSCNSAAWLMNNLLTVYLDAKK